MTRSCLVAVKCEASSEIGGRGVSKEPESLRQIEVLLSKEFNFYDVIQLILHSMSFQSSCDVSQC